MPPLTPDERPDTDDEIALRVERLRELSEALATAERDLASTRKERDALRHDLELTRAQLAALRRRWPIRIARGTRRRIRRLGSVAGRRGRRPADGPSSGATDRDRASPQPSRPTPVSASWRTGFASRVVGTGGGTGSLRVAAVGTPGAGSDTAGSGRDADDRRAFHTAVEAAGWTWVELDPTTESPPDVLVLSDDALDIRPVADGVVRVAWVDAGSVPAWLARPWFDEYDLVLTTSEAARVAIDATSVHVALLVDATDATGRVAALRDALAGWADAWHVDLAIGPPTWAVADVWGDYHFGRSLQRAFQRRGQPTRLRLRGSWDGPAAGRADVVIHLFGFAQRTLRPAQVNVLWVISHPDKVTDDLVRAHDAVFVASDGFAAALAARTGRDILALHQATDPDRFHPVAGGPVHDLLFVAGNRPSRRVVVDELTPTARDMAVFGRGWTSTYLDPRHFGGAYIPNDHLAEYYTAASIVLNDSWADMAANGFLSNRLYDAAACGAFVISDWVDGIGAEFDDGIVTFRDGPDLRRLVGAYLAAPDARAEAARRARDAVLARHTFAHRVETMLSVIEPIVAGRSAGSTRSA